MKFYQSRNFCFTDFELLDIEKIFNKHKKIIRYICRGIEICPETKRIHHQGWIQLFNKKTIFGVKKLFNTNKIHLESCRGDEYSNEKYCRKENKFIEFGKFITQGYRTDIDIILLGIMKDIEEKKSDIEICREKPEHYKNNMKFIARYRTLLAEEINKEFIKSNFDKNNCELNHNQIMFYEHLKYQDDRQITWINDPKGNSGKTWFSKYLLANEHAIRFTNGKCKDIAYAYNYEKYIIFDFSRSTENHINYGIIEDLKNGMLFSSKYESTCKMFKPPKIIIMANFEPDKSKMSLDRWDIININLPTGNTNTVGLCDIDDILINSEESDY